MSSSTSTLSGTPGSTTSNIKRAPSPLHPAAQHSYTSGIPGPPRILIPPHLAPPSGFGQYSSTGRFGPMENAPPGLAALLGTPAALSEWTYESRRQAQQVLPWVWLGSLTATKDKVLLAKRGITLMIAVRSNMTAKANLMCGGVELNSSESLLKHPHGKVGEPRYVALDLPAAQGAPLISTFRAAAQLIDRNYLSTLIPEHLEYLDKSEEYPDYHSLVLEHVSKYAYQPPENSSPLLHHALNPYPPDATPPGSTLVFCETGNEKSAVVVASYIMHHYEANLIQAAQVVQGRRFSVGFDDGQKNALAAWDPIFRSHREVQKAKQMVQQQNLSAMHAVGGGQRKRGFEESDEHDEENRKAACHKVIAMDGRSGTAPFRDDDHDPDTGMVDADNEEEGMTLN